MSYPVVEYSIVSAVVVGGIGLGVAAAVDDVAMCRSCVMHGRGSARRTDVDPVAEFEVGGQRAVVLA